MPGLRIEFQQVFTPQYANSFLENLPDWIVLGDLDYMEITDVTEFSQYFPDPKSEFALLDPNKNSPSGSRVFMNLVFDQKNVGSHAEFGSEYLLGFPFVAFVELSVSCYTLHHSSDFQEVQRTLEEIETFLGNVESEGIPFRVCRSLGHQDFVVVCALKDELQLPGFFAFVQRLRQVQFATLSCSTKKGQNHHIFSRVAAIVCCKTKSLKNQVESSSSINECGLSVITRVRVSPGHEEEIVTSHEGVQIGLESKGVRLCFSSIHSYAKWSLDPKSIRHMQNLGSMHSEILFKGANLANCFDGGFKHPEVKAGGSIEKIRTECFDSINKFAREQVGESQAIELAKTLQTFSQSLVRNEKLKTIRDLTVFVRQLLRYLGCDFWSGYLEKGKNLEKMPGEIESVTDMLWHAIRNRIEPQAESKDPLLPTISNSISSKIVNAHTVGTWMCWESLTGGNWNLDSTSDTAEKICGVCVCTGTVGRVHAKEVFSDFRQWVKDNHKVDLPPLLAVNISGPVLYHPEIAFVHCIHEMAEFTEWIASNHNPRLRELNYYLYLVVESLLLKTLKMGKPSITGESEVKARLILRLSMLKGVPAGPKKTSDPIHEISRDLQSWCASNNTLKLVEQILKNVRDLSVPESWREITKNEVVKSQIGNQAKNVRDDILDSLKRGCKSHESLMNDVLAFETLLREVSADFAMILWIAKLRRRQLISVQGKSKLGLRSDINYVYDGLFDALLAFHPKCGASIPTLELFITRWAIMHNVVNFHSQVSYESWLARFSRDFSSTYAKLCKKHNLPEPSSLEPQIAAVLARMQKLYTCFEDSNLQKSLSAIFRMIIKDELKNGDSHWMSIPVSGSKADKLVELFFEVWNDYTSNNQSIGGTSTSREEMIFGFWAESQKLGLSEEFA